MRVTGDSVGTGALESTATTAAGRAYRAANGKRGAEVQSRRWPLAGEKVQEA